jgi:uncharacterized protein YbjT (DUF2867 family)
VTLHQKILVTAAFGTQGRRLVPRLTHAGAQVRALRHAADGSAALRALGASEVVIGDAADPSVLREAMAGIHSVYHVGPSAHPREREMGLRAIEIAGEAGVRHFVYSSALHAIITALVQHEIKRDIEEQLVCSGLNFTILQPADFMQTLRYRQAFEHGELSVAWNPERRHSLIDVEDLAAAAAKVLLEGEPHYGATYELSSAGCHSSREIAAMIADVSGHPVSVREVSPQERMAGHYAGTVPDEGVAHRQRVFAALKSWYGSHDFVGNPNVLTMLLGRRPHTLPDFLRTQFARLRADPTLP